MTPKCAKGSLLPSYSKCSPNNQRRGEPDVGTREPYLTLDQVASGEHGPQVQRAGILAEIEKHILKFTPL